MNSTIQQALSHFKSISLKDMGKVKLMNRTDTKFIFNTDRLANILADAQSDYRILKINETAILDYQSQYFDTPTFELYLNHQNSKLNRYKIRKRKYLASNLSFFEVKFKSNKGRTIKQRIRIDDIDANLNPELKSFIENKTPYSSEQFQNSIVNNFSRITLVHKTKKERITIDQNLNYNYCDKQVDLDFLTIVEVKREGFAWSDFIDILKKHRIYPQSISKYCIGTLLLNKGLKYNRFKEKLLILKKITNNDSYNNILDRY